MNVLYGFVLGILFGGVGVVLVVADRIKEFSQFDFTISAPPVPGDVLMAVRQAEQDFYASQGTVRRVVESAQDVAAFVYPPLVYRLNFSVGPYRLKGQTVAEIVPWALENGHLDLLQAPKDDFHWLYVYFAEQPGLSDWGAAVYLETLRLKHPDLRTMTWEVIAADPLLVAKVYSGYLGAGGDWDGWAGDLRPGPVAASRLGVPLPSQASDG